MNINDTFEYGEDTNLRQQMNLLIAETAREPVPQRLIELAARLDSEIARSRQNGIVTAP